MRTSCYAIALGAVLATVGCGAGVGEVPPLETSGTFIDVRDGEDYRWVEIGAQVWMAENLAFPTPSGSWCYGDHEPRCEELGRLYDWPTALASCPAGWRLPSEADWDILKATLDPEAGTKLKEGGSSGFEAKLAGERYYDGQYLELGVVAQFWTSSPYTDDHALTRSLRVAESELELTGYGHVGGVSVRCMRDQRP